MKICHGSEAAEKGLGPKVGPGVLPQGVGVAPGTMAELLAMLLVGAERLAKVLGEAVPVLGIPDGHEDLGAAAGRLERAQQEKGRDAMMDEVEPGVAPGDEVEGAVAAHADDHAGRRGGGWRPWGHGI